jgi:hypothetical protein
VPGYWEIKDLIAGTGSTAGTAGTFTGNPATGTGGLAVALTSNTYIGASGHFNTTADTHTLNTGASAFTGSPPSEFTAWDPTALVSGGQRTLIGIGQSMPLIAPFWAADRLTRNRVITRRYTRWCSRCRVQPRWARGPLRTAPPGQTPILPVCIGCRATLIRATSRAQLGRRLQTPR